MPTAVTAVPTATVADATTARPDTREMLVVHTAMRREFRLAAGLVRNTPYGDRERAKVVTDHLTLMLELLHHHHSGEDALLWPVLLGRVGADFAPTVLLMEAQHERVSAQMDVARQAMARFAATAGPEEQIALAAACDHLFSLLNEHLEAEEQRLLPLAERHLTVAEWAKLGEQGSGTLPKRQLPLVFGFMMYEGDPEVIKNMLASAPRPIRRLIPRLARSAYRRYAFGIHGTSNP